MAFTLIDVASGRRVRVHLKPDFFEQTLQSPFVRQRRAGVPPQEIAGFFMVKTFAPPDTGHSNRWMAWNRTLDAHRYNVNLLIALPASFGAGLVSGLVGVGGGILKVPLMVLLLGIPMEIAVGSSAFMIGLTACGRFAGHLWNGHWDWRTSLLLALAVFAGGQIGSRISIKTDKDKLKKGFGWFLLAIAVAMLARSVFAQ